VEIAREIARRFNRLYGDVFTEPVATNPPKGARIMALDDPQIKMSKSAKSKYNYIWLLDKPDDIRQKISRAVTDSEKGIVFDPNRAGLFNLLNIYQIVTGLSEPEIEEKFAGSGYGELKEDLSDRIIQILAPIQTKYQELNQNRDYVMEVLAHGASKASLSANEMLIKVKKKIGLLEPLSYAKMKTKPVVSFEDWLKLDVEIGTIKSVTVVVGADKLYQICLDFGEKGEATIISGIREYYQPSELIGQQVPILKNLAEKEIKGVKSKGMILAVNNEGEAIILSPQKEAKSGSKVS
jgi:methionine--tRNA ligase beta chain